MNALLAGGAIPPARRGLKLQGLATVWDFYGTFAAMAGVDAADRRAAAAGLPPVDSVNLWPWISGHSGRRLMGSAEAGDASLALSPRGRIALGASSCVAPAPGCINEWGQQPSRTVVNGLIVDERGHAAGDAQGLWKLLVGSVPMDGWQGQRYPNASTLHWAAENTIGTCEPACLFNLDTDPTEHVDLAGAMPERVQSMLASLRELNATSAVFSPDRGSTDLEGACAAAMVRYHGFWGPWLP